MAQVTRPGVVKSTTHGKDPATGIHVYSAVIEYAWTVPNPAPPPPEIEHLKTETHLELDVEFYRDLLARVGKSVTVHYEDADANRTVSVVTCP